MARVITPALLLALVLALAPRAEAAERKGEYALGFSSTEAPVGVRYFATDVVAVDLGLGFESTDVNDPGTGDTDTASNFFVEVGGSYVVYEASESFFYVRPAVAFASFDDLMPTGIESRFRGELNLGAEVRLADHFGLTFEHGLAFESASPQGDGDSLNTFSTFGENVTEAGVWFTF